MNMRSYGKVAVAAALLLVAVSATTMGADVATPVSPLTFTNPILRNGADPWVIQRNGFYYLCQSGRGAVKVTQSRNVPELAQGKTVTVWTPPVGTNYSKEVWAPELHYLQGKWYIYVAADDGKNENHRMYVLEGTTQDPLDPFVFKGKLAAATDRWAIDGTVLTMPDGRLYFIWSGWKGFVDVSQELYIAPMSNPWTISGDRVCLSEPEHDWEKNGKPWVNEGPEVLRNGNKIFIIYSASGSWADDYCLGQLTLTGDNPMVPSSWIKKPTPVFTKTDRVFGPGHCSFVKSPDGTEDWIVYHAAKSSGSGWNRNVRLQKFGWNADGSPQFGAPIAEGIPIPYPK